MGIEEFWFLIGSIYIVSPFLYEKSYFIFKLYVSIFKQKTKSGTQWHSLCKLCLLYHELYLETREDMTMDNSIWAETLLLLFHMENVTSATIMLITNN